MPIRYLCAWSWPLPDGTQPPEGLELPVQLSADQIPICFPREKLGEQPEKLDFLMRFSLAQLQADPSLTDGVRIQSLEEILQQVVPTGLQLNLLLKSDVIAYDGLEDRVSALVEQYDLTERTVFTTANRVTLLHLQQISPLYKRICPCADSLLDMVDFGRSHDLYGLEVREQEDTEVFRQRCRAAGLKIFLRTRADADLRALPEADALVLDPDLRGA